MRARIMIAPILLLAAGAGCRGPAYYADKPPGEIAEMVQVQIADPGPGEARYTAPTIAAARSYRLAGRKDLDSGRTTHALSVAETAGGEDRYLSWARSEAEARVCGLTGARLVAGPGGSPAQTASFEVADRSDSCYPAEDCKTYPRTYQQKYKDEDGDTQKRTVQKLVRYCRGFWRCRSERIYEIALDDRSLRAARGLAEGMSVELDWSCGPWGRHADRIGLPAPYVEGYLLAVDGYPVAPGAAGPMP